MLNDLFQTYKRIIIIAVILLSVIVFWFYGCHRRVEPQEQTASWEKKVNREIGEIYYTFSNEQLSGEIHLGSAGHLARDRSGRADLMIRPKKSDFKGTVRFTLPGHDGEGVIYQEEIRAKAGMDNTFEMDIPALADPSCFFFEIYDAYDHLQLSEALKSDWAGMVEEGKDGSGPDIVFLGLCSGRANDLQYLDGMSVDTEEGETLIRLIQYDQETFPTRVRDLNALSGILIDHFDTGAFSPGQISCLKSFVEEKGGCLLLASGDYRKTVLAGLSDWLLIRPGGVVGKDIVFKTGSGEEKTSAMSVADFEWDNPSLWQSVPLADTDLVRKASIKKGKVILSAFSLTDEAFTEMTKKKEAAKKLLASFTGDVLAMRTAQDMDDWAVETSLYSFLEIMHPDTAFYGVFFIVYIGSIILIAYYVLRGMGKREYIWMAVPILSLVFTIFMGIGSMRTGNREDSSISTIRVIDSRQKENKVCLLYQNEEGEDKDMKLAETVRAVRPLDYEYRYNIFEPDNIIISGQTLTVSRRNKHYNLAIESATPGNSWVLEMTEERPEALMEGSLFDAAVTPLNNGFSGRIRNTSEMDFSMLFAIRGNQYAVLNDLKAGQEQTISESDVISWDNYEYGESSQLVEGDSRAANVVELVRYRYFTGSNGDDDLVLVGIAGKDGRTVFKDKNREKNCIDLYVDYKSLQKNPDLRYISNINSFCLQEGGQALSSDYLEQAETKTVYSFDPEKDVWSLLRIRDNFDGKIYAYNYQTGREDWILREAGLRMNREELLPYLSVNNQMIITYKLAGKEKEGSAPLLSMEMKMQERRGEKSD